MSLFNSSFFGSRDCIGSGSWAEIMRTSMKKVNCVLLTPEEVANIFSEVANKSINYEKNDFCMDIYTKIDINNDIHNTIYGFHYWIHYQGRMWKIGSGGYIPLLHKKEYQLVEFDLVDWISSFKIPEKVD